MQCLLFPDKTDAGSRMEKTLLSVMGLFFYVEVNREIYVQQKASQSCSLFLESYWVYLASRSKAKHNRLEK